MTVTLPLERDQSAAQTSIVVDVGGTNTRFAIASTTASGTGISLEKFVSVATGAAERFEHALETYIEANRATLSNCTGVGIGVAGPLNWRNLNGQTLATVALTNNAWQLDQLALQQYLHTNVFLCNDLQAQAFAVPILGEDQQQKLYTPSQPAWGPLPTSLVLGIGTGCGAALLLQMPSAQPTGQKDWHCIATEAGHANIALPANYAELSKALGAPAKRVSVETVLSGAGLARIYHWRTQTTLADRDIVEQGLADPSSSAAQTITDFFQILASSAGDMLLTTGAQQLIITGGLLARLLPNLEPTDFLRTLQAKDHFEHWLQQRAVTFVTDSDAALYGLAFAMNQIGRLP